MLKRSNLYDYQNTAINFIKDKKKCGLFLDMGLGKTTSTLTAMSDLINDFAICRVLVISTPRIVNNVWVQECNKWEHLKDLKTVVCAGTLKKRKQLLDSEADIYTFSASSVKWLVENYANNWKWDAVVFDEASIFKDYSSVRFKQLQSILHKIVYCVLLTGTPAANGYMGLWSQIYLIDNGITLGKNITAYRRRFFIQVREYQYQLIDNADHKIQELLKPLILSMKAKDYLKELPSCIKLDINISFDKKLTAKYKKFARDFLLGLYTNTIVAANTALLGNKLLQFANGSIYDNDKNSHHIHDLKIEALKSIVDEEPNHPLLVAYNFKSDLERLKIAFPNADVLDKNESTINKWNEGKIKMLIAHPASAGHGLNLQKGGSKIVWFGLNYSLELYQQFNARLHRQGQKDVVRVIHLIVKNTIDVKIMRVLNQKAVLQDELINYFKELKG
jgi:SNF2 family DNA or RNA helicase